MEDEMYAPPFSPVSYNGDYPDGEEPTCDICGRAMDDSPNILPKMRELEADWNGETGNHEFCEATIRERLEYLRGEIEAERISYGGLAELQDLAEHIDPSDVVLLEWAGVPEHEDERAAWFAARLVKDEYDPLGEPHEYVR